MTYWGKERTYHHTPPISLIYGLREALRLVIEEGLEARWERHLHNQQALIAGLEAMGLELICRRIWRISQSPTAEKKHSLPGVEDMKVRRQLLDESEYRNVGGLSPGEG